MSHVPLEQILDLPIEERVELAQQIWESVQEHPADVLLTATQKAVLEQRWLAFQDDPDEGEPWEGVRDSLLRHD